MTIQYIQTTYEDKTPVNILEGDPTKPVIFYHHGLYGSQSGFLGNHISDLSAKENMRFVSLDNLGHGQSTYPLAQADTKKWITTANDVIKQTIDPEQKIIIVANSFGAHVSHSALQNTSRDVQAFLGLSAAANVLTNRLTPYINDFLSQTQHADKKQRFDNGEAPDFPIPGHAEPKPISQASLQAASDYHITADQTLACDKVILIHGRDDPIVSLDETSAFQQNFNTASFNEIWEMPDGHGLEDSTNYITAGFYQVLDR